MTTGRLHLIDDVAPGEERPFLPGMGKAWLMPLYDPMTRLMGIRRYHERLLELAGAAGGQRVLDVGCGTGNLLLTAAKRVPGAELIGLDPDRTALATAARKAARADAALTLIHGYGDRLPQEDGSVDVVLSSMALHHLDEASRAGFAAEAFRVLRPGGTVALLDFGGPAGQDHEHQHGQQHGHQHGHGIGRALTAGLRRRALASEQLRPNLDDGLPRLLRDAGFTDAAEVEHVDSWMGPLSYVRATRPPA